jgi:hypothetical protein
LLVPQISFDRIEAWLEMQAQTGNTDKRASYLRQKENSSMAKGNKTKQILQRCWKDRSFQRS